MHLPVSLFHVLRLHTRLNLPAMNINRTVGRTSHSVGYGIPSVVPDGKLDTEYTEREKEKIKSKPDTEYTEREKAKIKSEPDTKYTERTVIL